MKKRPELTPEQQTQGAQMYQELSERIIQRSATAAHSMAGSRAVYTAEEAIGLAAGAARLALAAFKELEMAL